MQHLNYIRKLRCLRERERDGRTDGLWGLFYHEQCSRRGKTQTGKVLNKPQSKHCRYKRFFFQSIQTACHPFHWTLQPLDINIHGFRAIINVQQDWPCASLKRTAKTHQAVCWNRHIWTVQVVMGYSSVIWLRLWRSNAGDPTEPMWHFECHAAPLQ